MFFGSLIKKLLKRGTMPQQSTLLLAVRVVGSVLMFGFHILLGRLLGTDGYGLFSYAVNLAELALPFSLLGFPKVIIRYVAIYTEQHDWSSLRGLMRFSQFGMLSVTSVAGILMWLYHSRWATRLTITEPTNVAIVILLLYTLVVLEFEQRVLQGLMSPVDGALPKQLLRPIICIIGLFMLWWWHRMTPTTAIYVFLIANVAVTFTTRVLMIRKLPDQSQNSREVSYQERRLWRSMATFMLLIGVTNSLVNRGNIFILGNLSNPTQVAFYAAGLKVTNLINIVISSIAVVISPLVATFAAQRNHHALKEIYKRSIKWTALLLLPLGGVSVLFGQQILSLLGSGFTEGYTVYIVLLIGQMVLALTGPTGAIMNMTGLERELFYSNLAGSVLSIAISLATVPVYGALGAALASLVSVISSNGLMLIILHKQYGLLDPFRIGDS